MTQDTPLVEKLIGAFDAAGGYSLLMAGLPAIARHFEQAESPCLDRCVPFWVGPFQGTHQISTALRAPLVGSEVEYLPLDDADLLRDVLRLTGGNPHELMIVGHHLWLSCQLGEQLTYSLTPDVLDRVIPSLSQLTAGGDALRDGAAAIDRLPEELVRQAVDLVAMSRLSVREIAISRLLKVGSADVGQVRPGDVEANVEAEMDTVRAQLDELKEAGVIEFDSEDESFSVIGGWRAAVLLKYKALARIGKEGSNRRYGADYVSTVGLPLARDAMLRTLNRLPDGSASLGTAAVTRSGTDGCSSRAAIRSLHKSDSIERLVKARVDFGSWGADAYERIVGLLVAEDPRVVLSCTTLTYGRQQLEYLEAWEVPESVEETDLLHAVSEAAKEWEPVVGVADLKWSGSEEVLLRGEKARKVLIVLQRFAALSAVSMLFERWAKNSDSKALASAAKIAGEAVGTMLESRQSDAELDGELSAMLSRLGFLISFDDGQLQEARAALGDALRIGTADGWVTNWNLANVLVRLDQPQPAIEQLERVEEEIKEWSGDALLIFFTPGRAATNSYIKVTDDGIRSLLKLQRLVIEGDTSDRLAAAIECCKASGDPGTEEAAEWAAEAIAMTPV